MVMEAIIIMAKKRMITGCCPVERVNVAVSECGAVLNRGNLLTCTHSWTAASIGAGTGQKKVGRLVARRTEKRSRRPTARESGESCKFPSRVTPAENGFGALWCQKTLLVDVTVGQLVYLMFHVS